MKVSTFVITLTRSVERVNHVSDILIPNLKKHCPLDYHEPKIFEAVDGNIPNLNTSLLQENQIELKRPTMLRGQIGCFLSHFSLWKLLTLEKEDQSFLIFEDDANIRNPEMFWSDLKDTISETETHDPNWKWIYIYVYEDMRSKQGGHEALKIEKCNYIEKACQTYGTGAYIISKRGAQCLFDHFKNCGLQNSVDDTIMGIVQRDKGFYSSFGKNLVEIEGQLYKNEPNKKLKSNIW